ncbi:hypothetical protein AHiyo1_08180 [Arthrobacter sp. Hiyo1]|nr:hypothetical protein AHiyo1_08180 [Arthrobacter sp. Hiyo1]
MAHGNAVRNGNGAELHGETTAGVNAFLGALGEPVQREVAGGNFVPRARDADLGLGEVIIAHAYGPEHASRGGGMDAVRYDPAAWLDVRLVVCRNWGVVTHGHESMTLGLWPTNMIGGLRRIWHYFSQYFIQIMDSRLAM